VLILFWIGLLKFTSYEANGIKPFVENSPFMSWMYSVWSVQAASNVIGVIEVASAVLMATTLVCFSVSDWECNGSLHFLLTLSLFSTPPVLQQGLDFRFISCARTVSVKRYCFGRSSLVIGRVFKAMNGFAEWSPFVVQRS